VAGIFAGMVADKFGAFGSSSPAPCCMPWAWLGMAYAHTPLLFALSAGVLIGRGAGRHHLCRHLWRDRAQRGGRKALLGHGGGGGGRARSASS
jgi:hypothetical protein